MKQHLEKALTQQVDWVGDHTLYALLADGAARQQDLEALQQYAPLAEAAAVRYDHLLYQAIAARAWGVLLRLSGDRPAAESQLTRALGQFEEIGARWQIGRTLIELGELAVSQPAPEQARGYFSRALTYFEELDARPDAQRAHQKLSKFS